MVIIFQLNIINKNYIHIVVTTKIIIFTEQRTSLLINLVFYLKVKRDHHGTSFYFLNDCFVYLYCYVDAAAKQI